MIRRGDESHSEGAAMCPSVVEGLLVGLPFTPFTIHMQNGAEWEVDRPERVTVAGHQQALFLRGPRGELLADRKSVV